MQIKNIVTTFVLVLLAAGGFAQQHQTLYNMVPVPQRMYANPANLPDSKIFVELPVPYLSTYFAGNHTGFKYKDFIHFDDSGDSLEVDFDNLLDKLGNRNMLNVDQQTDLLYFGFRVKQNYFSLAVRERINFRLGYPDDLWRLIAKGNDPALGETLDFSGLNVDAIHYREYGIGYARELNEKITIGVKAKYLYGMENIQTINNELSLTTNELNYHLQTQGDITANASYYEPLFDSTLTFEPGKYLFGLGNHGFGVDLGVNAQINEKFSVSAGIQDLGFIRFKNNPRNFSLQDGDFTFNGLDPNDFPGLDTTTNFSAFFDSLGQVFTDSLENTFQIDSSRNPYTVATIPRFNVGGNYHLNDAHNVGLLFSGEVYKGQFNPAVTASFNSKFGKWFNTSVSYSYMNRSFANLGLGFALNLGPVQWYVISDNVLAPVFPQVAKTAHLHTGWNLVLGREEKDTDEDGIIDKEDDCPEEPGLALFNGCPDRDGDGIMDKEDNCPDDPGLPEFEGCPDRDKDGVMDKEDNCPDTPGLAEFAGCPDRDGDKIIDKDDACPDDPGPVETNGCPDRDQDGVLDSVDECPDKPGPADHAGCPDTDGDGLFDNEDNCVDKPGPIENKGCPYGDLDGDGVLDKDDRCPDTPGPVENKGCPFGDMDGDGVTDNVDECPQTPGPAENNGCPVVTEEEQEIIDAAFENLEFESGKDIIRASSYESLDSLATLLVKKPDWKLHIAGHTDNVGSATTNMRLSERRAKAVRTYLINKGVTEETEGERFIVEWFGEDKPIYPNDTPEGRQKNRRVEMTIEFD